MRKFITGVKKYGKEGMREELEQKYDDWPGKGDLVIKK